MYSELYKLGYDESLAALGLDKEAKFEAIKGIVQGAKNLLRRGRIALPSAARAEAAAMEMGPGRWAMEGGGLRQIPAAMPSPAPLGPENIFNPWARSTSAMPGFAGKTFVDPTTVTRISRGAGEATRGGMRYRKPRMSRRITEETSMFNPRNAPAATDKAAISDTGSLGDWWKNLPFWQKGALGLGALGGGYYMFGRDNTPQYQGPQQYYGEPYGGYPDQQPTYNPYRY